MIAVRVTVRVWPLALALGIVFASRAGADPHPVRLVTYNLNYANPDPSATMRAIADTGADIVLLQEVDGRWQRALADTFARRYPHQRFHLHGRAPGGLAVLSKLPITTDEVIPSPVDTWFPAERLVVTSAAGAVQILNVHLRPAVDGDSWIKGFLTTPPLRLREVEAYWPRLARDLPTLVAGDFNEDPSGTAVAFLGKHGLARVAVKGPPTWHWFDHGHEILKGDIDHVLIDSATLAARDGEVLDAGTSDHRPVAVTIERK
jgi:vancomycin resistance protein VanJ